MYLMFSFIQAKLAISETCKRKELSFISLSLLATGNNYCIAKEYDKYVTIYVLMRKHFFKVF